MPEPPRNAFQYAIVRLLPRVERGECLNVGVVLLCRSRRYLEARIALDERRLAALAPGPRSGHGPAAPQRHRADRRGRSGGGTHRPAGPGRAVPLAGLAVEHDDPAIGGPYRACATIRRPSSATSWRRWSTSLRPRPRTAGVRPRRGRPRASSGRPRSRSRWSARRPAGGYPRQPGTSRSRRSATARAARSPVSGSNSRKLPAPRRTARSVSRASARMAAATARAIRSVSVAGGPSFSSMSRMEAGRP